MKRDTGDRPASHLAVLVLTANREEDYLRRTVATLSRELAGAAERHRVYVCSAEPGAEQVLAVAGLEVLLPDVTVLLPCREPGRCGRFGGGGASAREAKVVHDFIACHGALEARLHDAEAVEHILGLEDDVLLMPSFFPTLASILALHGPRLERQRWLDVKLYLTPRLRGTVPVLYLSAVCCLLSTVYCLLLSTVYCLLVLGVH